MNMKEEGILTAEEEALFAAAQEAQKAKGTDIEALKTMEGNELLCAARLYLSPPLFD